MIRRALVAVLAVLVPRLATADGHKLLVLQSEGRVDAGLRAKIDAAITRLALGATPGAVAGELTFSDAATAVGCKPDAPACKDEVLGMLAVDEIIITVLTPKPGGLEIAARRFGKGGALGEATVLLAAGAAPDRLEDLAPLFSGKPAEAAPVLPEPSSVIPATAVPETARPDPSPPADQPSALGHRLELAGMGGGATMVTLGLVMWIAASSTQDEIDHAPTATRQDLAHLQDLESRGDGFATAGNVLAIGGLAIASVATYFYLRDRRDAGAATARLVPTVFDHGAGVVLTFGAAR